MKQGQAIPSVCRSVSLSVIIQTRVYISDVLLLVFAGLWEIHPWACGPEEISLLNRCYTYPPLVNFNKVYMLAVFIAAQCILM